MSSRFGLFLGLLAFGTVNAAFRGLKGGQPTPQADPQVALRSVTTPLAHTPLQDPQQTTITPSVSAAANVLPLCSEKWETRDPTQIFSSDSEPFICSPDKVVDDRRRCLSQHCGGERDRKHCCVLKVKKGDTVKIIQPDLFAGLKKSDWDSRWFVTGIDQKGDLILNSVSSGLLIYASPSKVQVVENKKLLRKRPHCEISNMEDCDYEGIEEENDEQESRNMENGDGEEIEEEHDDEDSEDGDSEDGDSEDEDSEDEDIEDGDSEDEDSEDEDIEDEDSEDEDSEDEDMDVEITLGNDMGFSIDRESGKVTKVDALGNAAKGGLMVGDLIMFLDKEKVRNEYGFNFDLFKRNLAEKRDLEEKKISNVSTIALKIRRNQPRCVDKWDGPGKMQIVEVGSQPTNICEHGVVEDMRNCLSLTCNTPKDKEHCCKKANAPYPTMKMTGSPIFEVTKELRYQVQPMAVLQPPAALDASSLRQQVRPTLEKTQSGMLIPFIMKICGDYYDTHYPGLLCTSIHGAMARQKKLIEESCQADARFKDINRETNGYALNILLAKFQNDGRDVILEKCSEAIDDIYRRFVMPMIFDLITSAKNSGEEGRSHDNMAISLNSSGQHQQLIIKRGVTKIPADYGAFRDWDDLEEVIFQEGSQLREISDGAFDSTAITAIQIPKSVTKIGAAFVNTDLTSVTFEEGSELAEIGDEAFWMTKVTAIRIPRSVTRIGKNAFLNTCLERLTFEEHSQLVEIGSGAFDSEISSLTSIRIPKSVKTIGEGAFYSVGTLEEVSFEEGSLLESISQKAFASTGLRSITIPRYVRKIYPLTFYDTRNLRQVIFEEGSTVEEIDESAFDNSGILEIKVAMGRQFSLSALATLAASDIQLTRF